MNISKINPRFVIAVLAAVAAVSLTANVVLYCQVRALKNDPRYKAEQEAKVLTSKVGALMILPDEQPTVATVTDPSKLQGQAFFARAKIGDKVLIFSAANKAVLYDPVADKIVEVAPLGANAAPPSAQPARQ